MHGMDARRRAPRNLLAGCLALTAVICTHPGAFAADPTVAAATTASQALAAPQLAAPPLTNTTPGPSEEETAAMHVLDGGSGGVASFPAADEASADEEDEGTPDPATAQKMSNWMDLAGLARHTASWIGLPSRQDAVARPLVVPDNRRVDSVAKYYVTHRRKALEAGYRRSSRYLPTIRAIFAEEGIPTQLAYLAAVESNYNPTARSRAQAAGLWQFMTFTARKFGLRVHQPWYDERLDPVYSTRAAARLLAYLHDEFGSWDLALAAYNAGEGRVNSAIRRAGQAAGEEDFWTLHRLPRETKGFVPAFFALARIYDDPRSYGLGEIEQEAPMELEPVEIAVATSLAELAKRLQVPLEDLQRLNPAWKRGFIPPNITGPGKEPVLLHVPRGHGRRVADVLAKDPPQPVRWSSHTVGRGESLYEIAQVYGVSLQELRAVNPQLKPRVLLPGQVVTLPVPNGGAAAAADAVRHAQAASRAAAQAKRSAIAAAEPGPGRVKQMHVVQSGESLWSIAQQYGVALADLKRWNGLSGNRLIPERELVVFLAR